MLALQVIASNQEQGLGYHSVLEPNKVNRLIRAMCPGISIFHSCDQDLGIWEDFFQISDKWD
jgi:hypothetical protein